MITSRGAGRRAVVVSPDFCDRALQALEDQAGIRAAAAARQETERISQEDLAAVFGLGSVAYRITFVASAANTLRELDRQTARRILEALNALADNHRPPGCIMLQGDGGELRIRIGDYRVGYDVLDDELVVLVLRLGHHPEVYR